jgi:hypothetical protein
MLRVYEKAINPEALKEIRTMFDNVVNDVGLTEKFYIDDNVLQMERTALNHRFNEMMEYYHKLFIMYNEGFEQFKYFEQRVCVMFTRVHQPSPIHVDCDDERDSKGVTLIIPLTFHDNIKTVAWKNKFNTNAELTDYKNKFINEIKSFRKANLVTKEVDISHCLKIYNLNIGEVMELDGIASWEPGNIIVFDKIQAHCSSNFVSHIPFKDYVLFHSR